MGTRMAAKKAAIADETRSAGKARSNAAWIGEWNRKMTIMFLLNASAHVESLAEEASIFEANSTMKIPLTDAATTPVKGRNLR